LKTLILVEGISDKHFLKELAEKLKTNIKIQIMRGNRPNKAIRLVKSILKTQPYNKVIILKDLHRYTEEKVKKQIRKIENAIEKLGFTAKGIIVKKAMEAWLLADPEAISKIVKHKVNVGNPEEIENPATYLDEIMKKCGKRYIKGSEQIYKLAKHINIENATHRSRSLKKFLKTLKDP